VSQLRETNVNLSKVYNIIGTFFGRIENVPFTKRCLRTLCGKISREQGDDDVKKTMEVFSQLKERDSEFTTSHTQFMWMLIARYEACYRQMAVVNTSTTISVIW
jgi:hypothetical protein